MRPERRNRLASLTRAERVQILIEDSKMLLSQLGNLNSQIHRSIEAAKIYRDDMPIDPLNEWPLMHRLKRQNAEGPLCDLRVALGACERMAGCANGGLVALKSELRAIYQEERERQLSANDDDDDEVCSPGC